MRGSKSCELRTLDWKQAGRIGNKDGGCGSRVTDCETKTGRKGRGGTEQEAACRVLFSRSSNSPCTETYRGSQRYTSSQISTMHFSAPRSRFLHGTWVDNSYHEPVLPHPFAYGFYDYRSSSLFCMMPLSWWARSSFERTSTPSTHRRCAGSLS
jgi:hypothetical protein